MKYFIKSYAKINLHLAVGEKRADNFHNLQSIFAKIDLFDTIEIDAKISDELRITILGLENCDIKGEDTITKATRLWCERANIKIDVIYYVDKKIPSQAGLGGGSSNAASTLKALNNIFSEYALARNILEEIALEVGSDVPFFLCDSTFAYVEGRGEIITPLIANFEYIIYLIKPHIGISTRGAFEQLDKIDRPPFKNKDEIIDIFYAGIESWKKYFFNDFELVIETEELKILKKDYNYFSLMSGSGSTCYSICNKSSSCYNKITFFRKFKNKNYTKSCFFLNI
ncbi:MAG: 4-(cytidine 5'-diphospho)-2-C-methyl-D-erythritol kinase [Spirochaetia bacterium]|nr:4-(cytidine 5'-diphospho)-2-C-methyl-D-erythritol kinase [Spirochaetia bacterium]